MRLLDLQVSHGPLLIIETVQYPSLLFVLAGVQCQFFNIRADLPDLARAEALLCGQIRDLFLKVYFGLDEFIDPSCCIRNEIHFVG